MENLGGRVPSPFDIPFMQWLQSSQVGQPADPCRPGRYEAKCKDLILLEVLTCTANGLRQGTGNGRNTGIRAAGSRGDAHRLSMPSRAAGAPTVGLVDDLKSVDTVKVHGYHGGYHGGYGGYHGGYGGYHGYSHGYYGGYHGYGRSYYGGYGFGRGYYGGYGYYPHYHHHYYGYGYYPSFAYSGYYEPYYYSTPSATLVLLLDAVHYYYSTPSYYGDPYLCPSAGLSGRVLSLNITTAPAIHRRIVEVLALRPLRRRARFNPTTKRSPMTAARSPAPMPKAEPTPDARPAAPQVDDHSVSLPAKVASRLVYPAYGEQAVPPSTPRFQERGVLVKGDPVKKLAK